MRELTGLEVSQLFIIFKISLRTTCSAHTRIIGLQHIYATDTADYPLRVKGHLS